MSTDSAGSAANTHTAAGTEEAGAQGLRGSDPANRDQLKKGRSTDLTHPCEDK